MLTKEKLATLIIQKENERKNNELLLTNGQISMDSLITNNLIEEIIENVKENKKDEEYKKDEEIDYLTLNSRKENNSNVKCFTNDILGLSVRVIQADDGNILINVEDAARSINLVYNDKIKVNGQKTIRWTRLNEYLKNADFDITVAPGDYIPEAIYYLLVMNSRSELGKKAKTWIAKEVIPSIRKHGAFMTNRTLEQAIANPDFMIGLLQNLKEEKDRNKELEYRVNQQKFILDVQQPKVEYYDEVLQPQTIRTLLTSTEIANDLGMSAVKFHELLKERKVIYKVNKTWVVYSRYNHLINTHFDYVIGGGQTLRWTELGREWIIRDILHML